jgi:hypothetical protein
LIPLLRWSTNVLQQRARPVRDWRGVFFPFNDVASVFVFHERIRPTAIKTIRWSMTIYKIHRPVDFENFFLFTSHVLFTQNGIFISYVSFVSLLGT